MAHTSIHIAAGATIPSDSPPPPPPCEGEPGPSAGPEAGPPPSWRALAPPERGGELHPDAIPCFSGRGLEFRV